MDKKTRIIALDYGKSRMGVAVSDELYITAQIKPTLNVKSNNDAADQIEDLIKQYGSVKLVLGLPLDINGEPGPAAEQVKVFGAYLKERLNIEVDYLDERFTSKQAEREIIRMGEKTGKNKKKIDAISAGLILQNYMQIHNF
ncbi:Holliday junction resolvase RuvX [candidate division KSB1 bacterium]